MFSLLKIWFLKYEINYWANDPHFRNPDEKRIIAFEQRQRRAKLAELEGRL